MVKKQNDQEIAQETVKHFLALLGVDAEATVTVSEEAAEITLATEESGMLIGYHGETLESLQLLLSLAISKKIGRFVRVSIEVGDYKKNRTEYLHRLAQQTKEKVVAENREYSLSSLKSWERRIVHVYLQDDEDVVSESLGEGRDRVLVIRPR